MKKPSWKKSICLTLLAGFISVGFAQKPKESSPLLSMVDTERAFAKMSEEQGTRAAFMAFIADDGILFRPRAVKGKQWMTENPVQPSSSGKRPLLGWQPTFADIARAGDMGYTTGPWEYRNDTHDAQAVAFGNFLTVWKKQPDGSWKFAIDLGISNPQPAQPASFWQPPRIYRQAMAGRRIDVKAGALELLARDREFSSNSVAQGAQKAFDSFAAADVRTFRNGKSPLIGKTAAAAELPSSSSAWNWEPASADVSSSGDLGYTYGTYRILKKDALPTILESGNYYRIWKKLGNTWLVVADLLDPVAEEKKN